MTDSPPAEKAAAARSACLLCGGQIAIVHIKNNWLLQDGDYHECLKCGDVRDDSGKQLNQPQQIHGQ